MRLIDAKALERQVKEALEKANPVIMGWLLRWIRKQPTIDAVPVVRCKDCKHFVQGAPYDPCECMKWTTKWGVAYTELDGFCHKGERRNDA